MSKPDVTPWCPDDAPSAEEQVRERWIPCSERLPDAGQWILLVWNNVVQRYAARLTEGGWEWADGEADIAPLESMSHWRPLPAPPTE